MPLVRDIKPLYGLRLFQELGDGHTAPFVGRDPTLAAVIEKLDEGNVALYGERSMGKTRLAIEVSERIKVPAVGVQVEPARNHDFQFDYLGGLLPRGLGLLVIDDFDRVSTKSTQTMLDWFDRLPVRVLLTGPPEMSAVLDGAGFTGIHLARMDAAGVAQLIEAFKDSARWDDALDLIDGRPGNALALAALQNQQLATILGPDGRPLDPDSTGLQAVELRVKDTSDAFVARFAENPQAMYHMHPRNFEELVAELYAREGFEVELTRASKDGGVDIYAVQRAPFGSFLTVVDCKRYAADRPIEVGLVRGLYGTVNDLDASMGVIATTSYFTDGAKRLQEKRKHRLGLQDFVAVQNMLKRAKSS
jgi:hypothetical protein